MSSENQWLEQQNCGDAVILAQVCLFEEYEGLKVDRASGWCVLMCDSWPEMVRLKTTKAHQINECAFVGIIS